MQRGLTLIDKSVNVCGSAYKLSQVTGWSEGNISKVRSGKRPLPLEWVPILCDLTGADVKTELALCLAEQMPEGSKGRYILEKMRATGVAAMLLFSLTAAVLTFSSETHASVKTLVNLTIYTSWNVLCALLCLFFMARTRPEQAKRQAAKLPRRWEASGFGITAMK